MGSHSVTCHPTLVNVPCLTWASEGWYSIYSIYFPRWHGRLSWPRWLVTYWNGWPTYRWWSPIQVLTGPDVEHLLWSRPTRYHYARPDHCSSDLLVKNRNILYPHQCPCRDCNEVTCGLILTEPHAGCIRKLVCPPQHEQQLGNLTALV